jgi:hypothetical protein
MKTYILDSKYHLPWRGLSLELRILILEEALNIPPGGAVHRIEATDLLAFRRLGVKTREASVAVSDFFETSREDLHEGEVTTNEAELVTPKTLSSKTVTTELLRLNKETYYILMPVLYRRIWLSGPEVESICFLRGLNLDVRSHIRVLGVSPIQYQSGLLFQLDVTAFQAAISELYEYMLDNLQLDSIELAYYNDWSIFNIIWCSKLGAAIWEARVKQLVLRYRPQDVRTLGNFRRLSALRRINCHYACSIEDRISPKCLYRSHYARYVSGDPAPAPFDCDDILDAYLTWHQAMYPFKFSFGYERTGSRSSLDRMQQSLYNPTQQRSHIDKERRGLPYVVMTPDPESARMNIEAAEEEYRRTQKDPHDEIPQDFMLQGEPIPNFDQRMAGLKRGLEDFEKRLAEKVGKRAHGSAVELAKIEE